MTPIKFLACMAGTGFVRNVGDVVPVPDDEARRLIVAGFAEAVPAPTPTAPDVVANKPTDKKFDESKRRAGRPPANAAPAPVETPAAPAPVEAAPVVAPVAGAADAPVEAAAEKPQ